MPGIVVYGGQFGDEGKGKVSEYYADLFDAVAVVRVGGSQADHTSLSGEVQNVLPTSHKKRISVLPLGSYIVLDRLRKEMAGHTPADLIIERCATVVIEDDRHEAQTSGRMSKISSHGLGTRSAIQRRLHGDFCKGTMPMDYPELRPFVQNTLEVYAEWFKDNKYVIIEGTQGYGLSNHLFDMYPYTTSRTITPFVFCCEAGIHPDNTPKRVMCLRSYPIRVGGNSGPMRREIMWEEVTRRSGSRSPIIEVPKNTGKTHRVSEFDFEMVKRAYDETEPTDIVLNMLDYLDTRLKEGCISNKVMEFIAQVERVVGKIGLFGVGASKLVSRDEILEYRVVESL